jgi:plasmid maintenance system antidote protein VapI
MSKPETIDASGKLFDKIIDDNWLKNDAALARYLEVNPPVISKVRHGKLPVGASMIINIHKRTGLSILKIEELIEA